MQRVMKSLQGSNEVAQLLDPLTFPCSLNLEMGTIEDRARCENATVRRADDGLFWQSCRFASDESAYLTARRHK